MSNLDQNWYQTKERLQKKLFQLNWINLKLNRSVPITLQQFGLVQIAEFQKSKSNLFWTKTNCRCLLASWNLKEVLTSLPCLLCHVTITLLSLSTLAEWLDYERLFRISQLFTAFSPISALAQVQVHLKMHSIINYTYTCTSVGATLLMVGGNTY